MQFPEHFRRLPPIALRGLLVCMLAMCVAFNVSLNAKSVIPQWCGLSTEQFDLYSSMPQRKMVTLATSLQRLHEVAIDHVPGEYVMEAPLKIVAFETVEEFVTEFQSDEYIGFMQPSMRQHVLAFGLADQSVRPYTVAFHEYTHYVSRSRYDHFVPMWYEEGFAQYLGLAKVSGDSVSLGELQPRQIIRAIRRNEAKWQTILDGVPRLDWHKHDYAAHYEFALAVVHYLHHGKTPAGEPVRPKVQKALLDISAGSPSSEVIPQVAGVSQDRFIPTLIEHFKQSPPSVQVSVSLPSLIDQSEIECLSELETRKLLTSVLLRKNPDRALMHIQRSLTLAPSDPDLDVLMSYLPQFDELSAFERTKRAYEKDPKHVDANIRIGDLFSYNCLEVNSEQCSQLRELASQHYRVALLLEPLRVDAAFGLGVSLLKTSRAGDGLPYLRTAYRRLPWNARINLFLGDAYMQVGDRATGRFHLERAAMWEVEEELVNRAIELMN